MNRGLPILASLSLLAAACGELEPGTGAAAQQPQAVDGDGYNDAPGSGHTYILDMFGLSAPGSGLDIDKDGQSDGVVNRAWQPVLGSLNNSLQAGVYSGRTLFGVEMSGVRSPYLGEDPASTLKLYDCDDADNDPTNNFCDGPGCAEIEIDPSHMSDGQTEYRSQPAPIAGHYFEGAISGVLNFELDDGVDVTVRQIHAGLTLPDGLGEIQDGVICAVSTARDLDKVMLPICEYLPGFCEVTGVSDNLSIAEYLVVLHFSPDMDLDGDGLETYELDVDAQVATCHDGNLDGEGGEIVGPDCLEDPDMADGYSLCFDFHAIPGVLKMPPSE